VKPKLLNRRDRTPRPANRSTRDAGRHLRSPLLGLVAFLAHVVGAQPIVTAPRPASTNQPDPLAAFMVAQPPIDTQGPIVPKAEFDPNPVTNGQQSVYRVTLNAMAQSIRWPDSIPAPANCTMRKGASDQFLANLGGAIIPQTTFLYHVRPQATGSFTLPAFTVRARGESVTIPATTLTVLPPGAVAVEPPPQINLSANGRQFFVGEDVNLTASFPGKRDGTVRTLTQVEVQGDGLIADRNYRVQRIQNETENGVTRPVYVYEALLTPMRSGRVEVTAHGHTVGGRVPGAVVITGTGAYQAPGTALPVTGPTYTLVDSDPLELTILPLPRNSERPGFTGAIGKFSVDPPRLSTNRIQTGDLLTLTLTVRGQGNLQRVLPPQPAEDPRWQTLAPRKEDLLPAVVRQRGFVRFTYPLIPLDPSLDSTPSIPFSYFDPDSRSYIDVTVPPEKITVDPSPNQPATSSLMSLIADRASLQDRWQKPEEPKALADLRSSRGRTARSLQPVHQRLGFAAFQWVPAILLGGIWYWDRRRRFLEQNPGVRIRRRARKSIRRHARRARRAAQQGDAREFLTFALRGFQEATAPAAPADPRALVCEDVISALPAEARQTTVVQTVRQLFTAANDWRFGDRRPDTGQLLTLARDVDRQLQELRDRL